MRPRWVIAELDVHGEIDAHAAMCLGFGIEIARERHAETILVDLRELTAIDADVVGLFVVHDAEARTDGAEFAILLCDDARQAAIVDVFTHAGLGGRLRFSTQPPAPPAPPRPIRLRARTSVSWSRRAANARR